MELRAHYSDLKRNYKSSSIGSTRLSTAQKSEEVQPSTSKFYHFIHMSCQAETAAVYCFVSVSEIVCVLRGAFLNCNCSQLQTQLRLPLKGAWHRRKKCQEIITL